MSSVFSLERLGLIKAKVFFQDGTKIIANAPHLCIQKLILSLNITARILRHLSIGAG
jgi:hypothetical protein